MNEHLFAINFPVIVTVLDANGNDLYGGMSAGQYVEIRVYAKDIAEALVKVRNGIIKAINIVD